MKLNYYFILGIMLFLAHFGSTSTYAQQATQKFLLKYRNYQMEIPARQTMILL